MADKKYKDFQDEYKRFNNYDYSNPHEVDYKDLKDLDAVLIDEDANYIKFFRDCTDSELKQLQSQDKVTVYDYTDHDYIGTYDMTLEPYLTEYVENQEEFLPFVRLLEIIFSDIKAVIDNFNNITNPDNVVDVFLPKLAYLLDYTYRYDLPDELNRDLIKRLIYLYKKKGTDTDLLNAVNYAENPRWIHDEYFLPDADITKKTAQVNYTLEDVFRHDISRHSGTDKYQDSTVYREGVLIIKSNDVLNDTLRNAIKRVLPAGIKCFYQKLTYPSGDSDIVTFNDDSIKNKNPLIHYDIKEYLTPKDNIRSSRFDEKVADYPNRFSGNQVLYVDIERN